MRVLLDECVPQRLRHQLTGHEVWTVPQMGWASEKNGALLRLAEGEFDALVTTDQRLSYQQSVASYNLARSEKSVADREAVVADDPVALGESRAREGHRTLKKGG